MLVSFWGAQRFAKHFTGPLNKLVDRMVQAQEGDLDSPVPIEGPKEIATLDRGFADLTGQLKKNIQVREDFVAIVSHDLKNPISSLTLAVGIIERQCEKAPEELKISLQRQLSIMRQVLTKMTELINAVLNLSAIRSGRFVLQYEVQDLKELVTTTAESYRTLAADRGLDLLLRLPENPIFARFDPNRLSQVLSNFLGNAIKFTPRGGTITAELTAVEKHVRVCVRDTGPGIAPEAVQQIFQRFAQGQHSRNDFSVGLGLYIAKEIIAAHGGRIWVESKPGQGAEFYFEIP